MNVIQKSEAITASLRKVFQDGSSKMAHRKCYGYEVGPNGDLTVNPDKAQVVCWIFERYLTGDSLGKIAAGLEKQGDSLPLPVSPGGIVKQLISYSLMKNILGMFCSRKLSWKICFQVNRSKTKAS